MEVEHMLDHQNGQKIKHVCVYYYLKNLIGIFLIYKFKIDSMKQAIVINEKTYNNEIY